MIIKRPASSVASSLKWLWLFLIMVGCSKNEKIVISGALLDPHQGIYVEDVNVELYTRNIESGIYVANYSLVAEVSTDAVGRFRFELDRKNFSGIKLNFYKGNYFGWEVSLNMDKISNSLLSEEVYQILPKAWIQISVKNTLPLNDDDYYEYRMLNGYADCDSCCTGDKKQFFGMDVNYTHLCLAPGAQEVVFQCSTRKNNEQVFKTVTHYLAPFDTTRILFEY